MISDNVIILAANLRRRLYWKTLSNKALKKVCQKIRIPNIRSKSDNTKMIVSCQRLGWIAND